MTTPRTVTVCAYDGGLTVTPAMKRILECPRPISIKDGGKVLRALHTQGSLSLNPTRLSPFGLLCFIGAIEEVKKAVESGSAPDLGGTETPYNSGYLTLVVLGAQRISVDENDRSGQTLKHLDVLNYLISRGAPIDLGDIVELTALAHAVTSLVPKHDLASALINAGADVNYQNCYGEVMIFGACQHKNIAEIELLMEHGADIDRAEADGVTPRLFFLSCGPRVAAVVNKWIDKRNGQEAPRLDKKCDSCGKLDAPLKNCSKCQVARYCSVQCQRQAWPAHKPTCQPFSASNIVTVKPFYDTSDSTNFPVSTIAPQVMGYWNAEAPPPSHYRLSQVPDFAFPKPLVIKVQIPLRGEDNKLFVYTKKRDFVCFISTQDTPIECKRIAEVVRTRGLKAYFAAELKNKDELVSKFRKYSLNNRFELVGDPVPLYYFVPLLLYFPSR